MLIWGDGETTAVRRAHALWGLHRSHGHGGTCARNRFSHWGATYWMAALAHVHVTELICEAIGVVLGLGGQGRNSVFFPIVIGVHLSIDGGNRPILVVHELGIYCQQGS